MQDRNRDPAPRTLQYPVMEHGQTTLGESTPMARDALGPYLRP